ncbi:MAG: exonuclease domain-containing protein [Aestuariivita sp.]|nr:exonuclease domain-containing protein [Aestuariivita sp.]MCY4347722.1 exonuclease domain-containing protein [Aestuariivita sp.]
MLNRLSLRLRIFIFFLLIAFGSLLSTGLGLFIGFNRAQNVELLDPFIFSGLVIVIPMLAIVTGIWLLFDENVAKPIERIAAELRIRAHTGQKVAIDEVAAKHLGDLAPAASALAGRLTQSTEQAASAIMKETERLAAEKRQLTALLSEIPVAMIVVSPAHQIVLYDSQSASILAQIAHPRLNASLFDYFEPKSIKSAYASLIKTGRDAKATLFGIDGALNFDAILKPLNDGSGYMLVIEDAHAQISSEAARPLVYDFDLLNQAVVPTLHNCRLSEICFVVFDCEMTGLLPNKDEVVQLAARRVVAGRIVEGEVFDTLVNPGIKIPMSATKVHKITNAMVQDAPDFVSVAHSFYKFCSNSVLVAHNAPFDLAFFHRYAPRAGLAWEHPVLDTVLLSAVLFGASVPHTLDALTERFGISIPAELRHSAIGDAQATAEVLCHMLPMLEARGLGSLGDVIAETCRHGRLLEDMN